jgi:hypothetical protein
MEIRLAPVEGLTTEEKRRYRPKFAVRSGGREASFFWAPTVDRSQTGGGYRRAGARL